MLQYLAKNRSVKI